MATPNQPNSRTQPIKDNDGFSCELDFLCNIPMLNNNDNKDTIWNQLQGSGEVISRDSETGVYEYGKSAEQKAAKRVVVFKESIGNHNDIKNYYDDAIYKNKADSTLNPYLGLLRDFEAPGFEGLRLESADFAYLTHLGVYPLNRLWILRRFKESDTVPDNLLDFPGTVPYPISTVVGWVSPEEENFFGVNFHEEWITQKDRIDEVLMKVLEQEFKLNVKTVIPVAGWGQGILLEFLNEMGATNFDANTIPFGNPNVLEEAATRVSDPTQSTYGLKSDFTINLKTSYEQKFIGDVDPGSAMLDIIRNLTRMGTSDVVYFAKNSEIFDKIRSASAEGNSADAWWNVITTMIKAFIKAITSIVTKLKDSFIKPKKKSEDGSSSGATAIPDTDSILESAGKTILTSTIGKWKWPLKGGLGVMTGENTTPWHLTVGNPYSPFISFGNVKVTDIAVDFPNELGFNDMTNRMNVAIKVDFGRNLGGQEIFAMFNNGYTRAYDTTDKGYISLSKLYKTSKTSGDGSGVAVSTKISTPT